MKRGKRSACPFCIENYGTSTRSTVRFLRFVSDKEVQVSELEKSKRERKFKHFHVCRMGKINTFFCRRRSLVPRYIRAKTRLFIGFQVS